MALEIKNKTFYYLGLCPLIQAEKGPSDLMRRQLDYVWLDACSQREV